MAKEKFRVENITHTLPGQPTNGFVLDFQNTPFTATSRPLIIECEDGNLPDLINAWREKGYVRVRNATSGELVGGGLSDGVVTAGPKIDTASGEKYDSFDDDGLNFDPTDAREAVLPNGAHMPSTAQQSRVKVSEGLREEKIDLDGISPLPGERATSVDDSGQFTIKAPRNNGAPAIVR